MTRREIHARLMAILAGDPEKPGYGFDRGEIVQGVRELAGELAGAIRADLEAERVILKKLAEIQGGTVGATAMSNRRLIALGSMTLADDGEVPR